jgi:hypothetical protein
MIENRDLIMPIVTFDDDHDWDTLLELADPYLDDESKNFLANALKDTTCSVAVERHYIDKDYRDTFVGYHARRFVTPDSRCIRLHFFATCITAANLAAAKTRDEKDALGYLGYSIIRPTRPNSIGRTLIAPNSRTTAHGSICMCRETPCVQGTQLEVHGFPLIRQDTDATVCAESALWMLLRYFSNRYPCYREIYPFQITELTRDYSLGRIWPSTGLYTWQMAEALRRMGFHPLIYDRGNFPDKIEHLAYTYIESGFPVLLTFEDHVVVGIGHESSFDDLQELDFHEKLTYSSDFNQAFVINDDNDIPYILLKNRKEADPEESKFAFSDIESIIVPLPDRVFLAAEAFQDAAETVMELGRFSIESCSENLRDTNLILRCYITTCRSYKASLSDRGMGSDMVEETYRQMPLPHFVWVCEISTPELYPKRIIGEILWDATRNAYEPAGLIAVHYPDFFAVDIGSVQNALPEFQEYCLTNSNGYDIYRHNLKDIIQ